MNRTDSEKMSVRQISGDAATAFLVSHSPLANTDLLAHAASDENTVRLLGLYYKSGLIAVASIRIAAQNPAVEYGVSVECPGADEFLALLAAGPPGRLHVKVHDDTVASWFEAKVGLQPWKRNVYFAVSRDQFKPQSTGKERVLTRADLFLFPASMAAAAKPDDDESGRIVWGVERSGQIVCSAAGGQIAKEADICVGAVAGLYTEKGRRCCGLATQLVSAMTETLLADNDYVLYWTAPDNVASQRVATKLGYVQTHIEAELLVDSSWAHAYLPQGILESKSSLLADEEWLDLKERMNVPNYSDAASPNLRWRTRGDVRALLEESIELEPSVLDRYTGVYCRDDMPVAPEVSRQGMELWYEIRSVGIRRKMIPVSEDTFELLEIRDFRLRFPERGTQEYDLEVTNQKIVSYYRRVSR